MIVNQANLHGLTVGYSTAFNKSFDTTQSNYQKVATVVPSTTGEQDYKWLGQMPGMREWIGEREVQALAAYDYLIKNKKFEMTIGVPRDDIEDDKYGVYAVSSGMLAAKNYASTQLSNMQAAYQSSGGGIKGIVAATMTGVQGTFSTAYSVINNLTGGKLESIRSTISNKIQAAKDTVSSVLDSIKSAFSSKLEAARSVVSSTIEKIKGVFNFSWKLPDLKLPHISVNGGQAPYGIGGKGSLPSFSIQWYKEGGILNGATIFGAMGGNLLGGGEAGAEAVLPLSELWKQMTEIVKGVVKGENEESGDTVQQTGANITSALTSKAASVRKEKESKTTTTKETYTSERWGKEGGTTIHQISFTVDISKIKDLPLLYKLIDELKDAQNRTDSPTPATT